VSRRVDVLGVLHKTSHLKNRVSNRDAAAARESPCSLRHKHLPGQHLRRRSAVSLRSGTQCVSEAASTTLATRSRNSSHSRLGAFPCPVAPSRSKRSKPAS